MGIEELTHTPLSEAERRAVEHDKVGEEVSADAFAFKWWSQAESNRRPLECHSQFSSFT
jgi:hypothetical protein